MARKQARAPATGRTVLVVDDNREYLVATERLLARNGHTVIAVEDPVEGLALLRRERVDLVLVDFFMPQMTGEVFVEQLRTFNPLVQVILQTGYASEQPPRELLRRLDIQGYYDKGEGPDKLLLWTDVGLKAAFTVQLLEKSRLGLKFILDATPELHRMRPLDDLLRGILEQTTGLLGAADAFLAVHRATPPDQRDDRVDAFVAVLQDATDLVVRAGTGRFQAADRIDRCFSPAAVAGLRAALEGRRACHIESGTIVPLAVGETVLGAIYVDRCVSEQRDVELLEVFANQAAVAIHNAHLYEMAALDPLTGVFTRRFFQRALVREVKNACGAGRPLALIVVDVDDMKHINDTGGHLRGDEALAAVGRTLRSATTPADAIGRFGGDEFVVVLPGADATAAAACEARILLGLSRLSVESASGPLPVRASLGTSVLDPPAAEASWPVSRNADFFGRLGKGLIQRADQALYAAKRGGRGQALAPRLLTWPPPPLEDGGPEPSSRAAPCD